MYIERDNEARSCSHFCNGKAVSIKYSECVSIALVIQHAVRMPNIILSSVPCAALPYFSALFHKRRKIFENMKLLNMISVF